MNSVDIVAKYTQKHSNENAQRHQIRFRMATSKDSVDIVAKYTQNHTNGLEKKKTIDVVDSDQFVSKYPKKPQLNLPFSRMSISKKESAPPLLMTSTTNKKWTLWSYDCRDFSVHTCFYDPCQYCDVIHKLRLFFKKTDDESKDCWENYLQKGKVYDDETTLLNGLAESLPSKLAKDVYFKRKLGVGIFRGDIMPNNESAENIAGGVYQLLLLATAGQRSAALLPKFDALFLQTLQLIFDMSPTIARHVNGLFYRCQINPGKGLEQQMEPYGDMGDLPFMAKLEIWIDDCEHEKLIYATLINNINKLIKELEIPFNAFRRFCFFNRIDNGVYFDITAIRKKGYTRNKYF
ncbi:hypothetical protein GPALN_004600 [Globodera pallida]|nr:hypothetical protein GPALN_004600 [Globodera pallida]